VVRFEFFIVEIIVMTVIKIVVMTIVEILVRDCLNFVRKIIQNVKPKRPLVISTWNVEFELHRMISI
jgi:hypothetical protein